MRFRQVVACGKKLLPGIVLTLAVLAAAVLLLDIGVPRGALAGHDMGKQCYFCHNIQSSQVWPNSYSIYSGKFIGMRPYSRPITCDVCHTDYGQKFTNVPSNLSRHPVRIIAADNTLADNNVYGSSPAYIDCRDCHTGDVTSFTPNLNPDVSPLNYLGLSGNAALDGYPDHDNTIPGFTVVAASWSGQNVVTGGTEPHLGSTWDNTARYNKVVSADNTAALTNYALCFSCHDGSARTNRRVDVKTKYLQGSGHYYKASGSRMSCSDCHTSHSSSSSRLYAKPANAGTPGAVVYSNPAANPSLAADVRKLCMDCHDDWNAGDTTNGTPLIRGVEPSGRKYGVAEHASGSLVSCTASGCHDAHDAPASCNTCHGYAGDGSGAPPASPTSGNLVWSASVDRVGTRLTQGMHRVNASDNVMRTDHDAYVCSECHTPTPGSGGTHNDGLPNATMDNLVARRWTDGTTPTTFTPRTDGATGSVVDDSCNNVNCHSPFGPYQATQPSGTPFPYERYWENYGLWDCYTCHGYKDSDATVDNTNNPGALDRHINTGAHDRHTRTVAKGGLGYDCARCHATGNTTLYSAGAPAGDNVYPGTHKSGYVDWSFAGAPNPFGVAPSSLTYSGSQLGGSPFVATDNAGAHRKYGSCANLYCHSIGQHPTTGLALTANDNTHYRPPKWDNTFGGKCGDCHGGDGATDNAASLMSTGSHRQHDNTAPYAYACAICHNGLGRGTAKHVDNQVSLAFGAALPAGGTIVTATYSQGLDNAAGNGYGNCTATYCHGTDPNVALRLSGGSNQATGTTNRPTWGDNTTGNCGSCHGAPGATTNYPPATYVGTQNYPGGAHARHVDNTVDQMGPRPVLGCSDCHTAATVSTHVNGQVTFRAAWDNAAATDKAGTRVCDPCHGSGVNLAKAQWDNTSYFLDCLTCHGSTAAYTFANGTGRVAPAVDNGAYGSNTGGHNRSAGNYTSGNPPANNPLGKTACTVCHKASLLHINNVADNSYSGNRLSDNVNAQTGRTTITLLCEACHTNAGSSTAGKNKVNTHGNTSAAFKSKTTHDTNAQDFVYNCDACHDPHGMTNNGRGAGTYNIYMIKPLLEVRNFSTGSDTTPDNTTTVGPVYFESLTGTNSYDDGTTSPNTRRLCIACHVSGSRPGNTSALTNPAGDGTHVNLNDYTANEQGKDCASCHNHNVDDNVSTVDGLMPQQCNGCHSYPGLDNAGASLRQMSRGHWDHVGKPLAGGTDNSHGFQCTVCHLNYTHNQSNIAAGGSWASFNPNTVNVRFDASWNAVNANGPRYAGALAGPGDNAVGNGGTGVCAGLYCHGNNATSSAGWNGSAATPRWDNVGGAPCGACHDTGTADTTSGTRMSTGNHPVHLDNASKPYGPETWQFSAGGNCAEGAGCHTKYGLTPNDNHLNGFVNFRTTLSDNTAATLGTTQICQRCHSTYANAGNNLPTAGDVLVRTPANWDNATYQVPCITCHNDSAQAPPNPSQGTVRLDGSGNRAPNILAAYYTSGHGASGIDNGSTASMPPIPCATCHFEQGGHIGGGKTASNPWRLDNALTKYAQAGGLDNYCMTACHANASPAKHAWIRVGVGASAKDNTAQTHPASIPAVPQNGEPSGETTDKSRWFQVPADTTMPLGGTTASPASGDLNSDPIPARLSTAYGRLVMCVTCHDPHGVGTAPVTPRTFSGANTEGAPQMLRYNYSGTGLGVTPLCAKCHK